MFCNLSINKFRIIVALILYSGVIAMLASCKQAQNSVSDVLLVNIDYALEHRQISRADSLITVLTQNYRFPISWKKNYYSRIANFAEVSEEYGTCLYYLEKMGKRNIDKDRIERIIALSKLPKMTCCIPDNDITLEYLLDSVFFESTYFGRRIRVPVEIGGVPEHFTIDNGAAICFVNESFAKAHSIHNTGISSSNVDLFGNPSLWIGIADSLSIGSLEFHNVKFSVIPDSSDSEDAVIQANIGNNILRACGEMSFDNRARTITFRNKYEPLESNLTIKSSGAQYVDATVQGDTLKFLFDLGATNTSLYSRYLQKIENITDCQTDSIVIKAPGGMRKEMVYIKNDVTVETSGGKYILEKASVFSSSHPVESTEFGIIGNDFLLNFNDAVLNIDKLYLYVTN